MVDFFEQLGNWATPKRLHHQSYQWTCLFGCFPKWASPVHHSFIDGFSSIDHPTIGDPPSPFLSHFLKLLRYSWGAKWPSSWRIPVYSSKLIQILGWFKCLTATSGVRSVAISSWWETVISYWFPVFHCSQQFWDTPAKGARVRKGKVRSGYQILLRLWQKTK